jgi:hypothetical protein
MEFFWREEEWNGGDPKQIAHIRRCWWNFQGESNQWFLWKDLGLKGNVFRFL